MAGEIQAAFDSVYQDGPSNAPDNPIKPLIRTQIGTLLESKISGLEAIVGDLESSGALIGVEDLPSAGEKFDDCKALNLNTSVSGATTTFSVEGYPIGFVVPSNSDGHSANISTYPLSDPNEIAALAGRTIYITAVFDATSGFLDRVPLSTAYVDIGRGQGVNGGNLISDTQVGGTLTRTVGYTVIGNESAIGLIAQVSLAAVAAPSIASLTLRSVTYRVVSTPSASSGSENIELALRGMAQSRFGVSITDEKYENSGVVAAGVSWLRDADTNYINGWSIPAGTAGGFTYINSVWYPEDNDALYLGGANIRVTIVLETSPDYARVVTPLVGAFIRPTGGAILTDHRILSQYRSSTIRTYVVEGIAATGLEQFNVTLQNGVQSGGVVSSDMTTLTTDTMTILNVIVEVIDAPIAGITGAMATAKLRSNITSRLAMKRNQLRASEKNKTVKVAPSGGDFTSLATAMAGTGAGVRFAIDGTYSQAGSSSPFFFPTLDDLEFAGVGQRKPVFAFTQAQNATLANITSNSTCDSHYNAVFRNLWMTAENARYVIHADASNSFFRKKTVFEECYLEHKGNESARAYVVANGGTSSDVWSNCYAVGAGIPDGGAMVVRNSVLLGYNADALHCHNWGPCEQPVTLDVEGCILDARPLSAGSSKYSFYWGNLGSLQNDVVRVVGNTLGGPVALGSSPWLLTDPAQVPANKMLASVTGYSNTPAPYVLEDDGSRALRITSATTGTSSSVVVSGTGADALFGGSIDVAGAVGLAGASYGYLDCGDHLVGQNADQAVTQIGKRLGNCSSVNKTLTVLIDGSTTKTVTFNQDYTSVSNTTILASINTALGSSATADLFNVNELFRPRFTDEERRVYNAGATTIKRKMAVAWATNGQPQSRIMTAADPLRLFAGIAYEDIRPGTWGRVKSAGMVRVAMDLLRSDSGAFVHGDAFGVGATDGQWVKSPGVPLLFAVNNADVRFGTFDNDTAWTSFTPTILSQTGTLTTAAGTGRWRRVGRQIHLQVSVTITTNGTGAGSVRIMNLPAVSAAAPYVLIGRESALNGKALLGSINSSSSFMSITNYDNSYPGADGAALNITGCYEAAA